MRIIAHRGASGDLPENTLASFSEALRRCASEIELDVHKHGDELLVIHDETLDRTTNGSGPLSSRSLDELRTLDAGNGERIPLLREVIEQVARRARINIELKGEGTAQPVAELVHRFVERGWRKSDFLISSFHERELYSCRDLDQGLPISVLTSDPSPRTFQLAGALRAESVSTAVKKVTPWFVQEAHQRNLQVLVYTVNGLIPMQLVKLIGVDGIFTDYPGSVNRRLF